MDSSPIAALITEMQSALAALPLPERGLALMMLVPDFPDAAHNHIEHEQIAVLQYRHRIEAVRDRALKLQEAIADLLTHGYPHVPTEVASVIFLAILDKQVAALLEAKKRFQLANGAAVLPEGSS